MFVAGCSSLLQSEDRGSLFKSISLAIRCAVPVMTFLLAVIHPPAAFLLSVPLAFVSLVSCAMTEMRKRAVVSGVSVALCGVFALSRFWHFPKAFVVSALAQNLKSNFIQLVRSTLASSLHSHLCLGYSSFPIVLSACSLLSISLAMTCVALGQQLRDTHTKKSTRVKQD
eukprot:Gregarina_sp_Pseudo_9__1113@NODE_1726_length_1367_cov_168_386295_g1600_i0_p1_GENE_NODE_1726_length_1367_cov_168_386295_g1600_i0NODE_1726_length_1367_cov_168_386295_g1600_i0_p1_ORF_typecomplete_len170_score24_27PTPS_related/PF10131_9/0_28_NODE_1726_length_1367_cov_168_386295_g1600_i08561365